MEKKKGKKKIGKKTPHSAPKKHVFMLFWGNYFAKFICFDDLNKNNKINSI
jgi:hypothetical protein